MQIPLDGSAPRPLLATKQRESDEDWSPANLEFAYVSGESIWLRRAAGSGRDAESRSIVSLSQFGGERFPFVSPAFSPDGTRIAYATGMTHGTNLWISSVSGGAPAPVGDFKGNVTGLTWSPDGRWIALNYAESGLTEGRLMKIQIGSVQALKLADESCSSAPVWSPDSSLILCSKDDVLYTIPADGGKPVFWGKEYEPLAAWSRDMRFVYAIRAKDGKRELGKLDWKSGSFQRIVAIPLEWTLGPTTLGAGRLSLAPDGKSLATTIAQQTGDIWILEGFQQPPTLWQRLIGRR